MLSTSSKTSGRIEEHEAHTDSSTDHSHRWLMNWNNITINTMLWGHKDECVVQVYLNGEEAFLEPDEADAFADRVKRAAQLARDGVITYGSKDGPVK